MPSEGGRSPAREAEHPQGREGGRVGDRIAGLLASSCTSQGLPALRLNIRQGSAVEVVESDLYGHFETVGAYTSGDVEIEAPEYGQVLFSGPCPREPLSLGLSIGRFRSFQLVPGNLSRMFWSYLNAGYAYSTSGGVTRMPLKRSAVDGRWIARPPHLPCSIALDEPRLMAIVASDYSWYVEYALEGERDSFPRVLELSRSGTLSLRIDGDAASSSQPGVLLRLERTDASITKKCYVPRGMHRTFVLEVGTWRLWSDTHEQAQVVVVAQGEETAATVQLDAVAPGGPTLPIRGSVTSGSGQFREPTEVDVVEAMTGDTVTVSVSWRETAELQWTGTFEVLPFGGRGPYLLSPRLRKYTGVSLNAAGDLRVGSPLDLTRWSPERVTAFSGDEVSFSCDGGDERGRARIVVASDDESTEIKDLWGFVRRNSGDHWRGSRFVNGVVEVLKIPAEVDFEWAVTAPGHRLAHGTRSSLSVENVQEERGEVTLRKGWAALLLVLSEEGTPLENAVIKHGSTEAKTDRLGQVWLSAKSKPNTLTVLNLGGHFKSGQSGSVQNRPVAGAARDERSCTPLGLIPQGHAALSSEAAGSALEDVGVV